MTPNAPRRELRARPDLDQLKRQAKELLAAFRAGEPDAVAEVVEQFRGANAETFALHDAQLVIARSHGFASWPKLKAHVDGVTLRRLVEAVRAGDLDQARKILDVRPELVHVDMADHDEHRVLHYAVLDRAPDMVRLLMQYGADARQGIYPHRDATGALTIAIDRGYDEIVDIIRDEEAKRRSTGDERTPLPPTADVVCETIASGERDKAIVMLEADPTLINARHRDGWTPLHAACAALDQSMVAWLIDRGAAVNARGESDRTPLDIAVELQRVPGRFDSGRMARIAFYLARRRFRSIARLLRKHGAELSPASAVALGDTNWLRACHARANLANAVSYGTLDQATGLLTLAVLHDRPDILALLLSLGLDPNERIRLENVDNEIYSAGAPLQHCATTGKLEMAKVLLQAGADPNVRVYASSSSMGRAYLSGNAAMIELLRSYGGVVDAVMISIRGEVAAARQMLDDEAAGRLPRAALAHELGGDAVAEYLAWGGAGAGAIEIVRMALAALDWPRTDPRWYSLLREPLYIGMERSKAERESLIECFRLILERADPAALGTSTRGWVTGRTLLHDLSPSRHTMPAEDRVMIATMLLDAGAPFDVRDDLLKSTPLGWACRWGRVELVELLLARGADPIEADAEPWATPLAWATKRGHTRVVELLNDVAKKAP